MKRSSNKMFVISLASVMALGMGSTPIMAAETKAAKVEQVDNGEIIVLYTNDIHCGVSEKESMGIAGVAAYKADMIAQYGADSVTLVDCGDAIQGTALGTLSKGDYMIDIMNATGYDLAIFGNHEFDYSMPTLKQHVEKAKATYVSCNFNYTGEENEEVLKVAPYAIKEYDGVKVAYVGINTPETLVKSTPKHFMNEKGEYVYSFSQGNDGKDLYAAVQKAVDAARREGAKYVIALSHLGIEEGSKPYRSTDMIANTKGIDVVLDGHSHSTVASEKVKNAEGKEVLISQTGTKLATLGKLVITKDGKFTTELIESKDYTKKDEAVDKVVTEINNKLNEVLNKVVAQSEIDLSINHEDGARAVRNRETAIGNLSADAYRNITGADLAIVNGGGIRASLAKGDITYKNIMDVHPFGNKLQVAEVTGEKLLDALEMASRSTEQTVSKKTEDGKVEAVGENGGFLHVSGLKYTIDLSVASSVVVDENKAFVKVEGARRVKNVQVLNSETGKYEPIQKDKTYKVASHNFMFANGDGFTMLSDCKAVQTDMMLDNEVLIKYITEVLNGTIDERYSKTEGRITILGEAGAAAYGKKAA